MTGTGQRDEERTLVELEFDLGDSDVFFREASADTECQIQLETVVPRTDGSVLEFLRVDGADPDEFLGYAERSDAIERSRLIDRWTDGGLFELVSSTRVATAIADQGALYSDISATSGEGRLVVEAPPHLDTSSVIEAFLAEYPNAELLAKRETDRTAPLLSRHQFVGDLLDDLTEKQLQALRTAHANRYFDWPRGNRAEDIAAVLDVATPTFSQHIRAAERKIFDALFD